MNRTVLVPEGDGGGRCRIDLRGSVHGWLVVGLGKIPAGGGVIVPDGDDLPDEVMTLTEMALAQIS